MSKKMTRMLAVILTLTMLLSAMMVQAFAENLETLNLSKQEIIEQLIETRLRLRMKMNQTQSENEYQKLQNRLDELEDELIQAGAEKVTAEKFMELNGGVLPQNWHPSDILSTFEGGYLVWGYENRYNGCDLYHVAFESNNLDPYLRKEDQAVIYSSSASDRSLWNREVIKAGTQRILNEVLQTSFIVDLTFGLIDLIDESLKPAQDMITYHGEKVKVEVDSNAVQKFVYKYMSGSWVLAASVNMVGYHTKITQDFVVNYVPHENEENFEELATGDYYNADAIAASYTGGAPIQKAIKKIKVYSQAKQAYVLDVPLYTPTNVSHMIY